VKYGLGRGVKCEITVVLKAHSCSPTSKFSLTLTQTALRSYWDDGQKNARVLVGAPVQFKRHLVSMQLKRCLLLARNWHRAS
jgi:hypothetical protein